MKGDDRKPSITFKSSTQHAVEQIRVVVGQLAIDTKPPVAPLLKRYATGSALDDVRTPAIKPVESGDVGIAQ